MFIITPSNRMFYVDTLVNNQQGGIKKKKKKHEKEEKGRVG